MSLDVYSGTMGSGKSHEVCKEVILQHVKKGRGVVVIGMVLDVEAIGDRLDMDCRRVVEEFEIDGVKRHGSKGVACFDGEAVKRPHFFPTEAEVVAGLTSHCVVQPGDLVVWDEAWRSLGSGEKLAPEHMEFIRMHRHYAHPKTGTTSDIVVLIQDVTSLNRKVKNVVESVWHLRKLRSLGLNKAYVLNRYEGNRVSPAALVSNWRRTYDKTIFPLYQSHSTGGAVEGNIDRRTVFWKDPKFIVIGVLAVLGVVFGPILTMHYLWGMAGGKPASKPAQALPAKPGAAPGAVPPKPPEERGPVVKRPPIRIVGSVIARDGSRWVLLDPGDGVSMMPDGSFQGTGVGLYGDYEGKKASTWGGSIPSTAGGGGGLLGTH